MKGTHPSPPSPLQQHKHDDHPKPMVTEKPEEEPPGGVGGAIMGGSLRGALLLNRAFIKSQLRKQSFLRIGERAKSTEASHERALVTIRNHAPSKWKKFEVRAEGILLGIVVFGSYEYVLHRFLPPPPPPRRDYHSTTANNFNNHKLHSVLVHMMAGATAGVAQSTVWMGWESLVHNNWQLLYHRPYFCLRTTVHHAGGYAALFGSYQAIRQGLLIPKETLLPSSHESMESSVPSAKNYPLLCSLFEPTATFVAGGLAGQIHHVVNHYTSHWKRNQTSLPRPPRLGPTTSSFIPIALSFTAYEYGEEFIEHGVHYFEGAATKSEQLLRNIS